MFNENKDHKLYVLVVDDWADAANTLAELIQVWGMDAQAAYDGKTAVRMAHERKPDLIFMDIAMPIMDGIAAAQQLRSEPGLDYLIVALTAYGEEPGWQNQISELFDKCLPKPADPDTLYTLLAAA